MPLGWGIELDHPRLWTHGLRRIRRILRLRGLAGYAAACDAWHILAPSSSLDGRSELVTKGNLEAIASRLEAIATRVAAMSPLPAKRGVRRMEVNPPKTDAVRGQWESIRRAQWEPCTSFFVALIGSSFYTPNGYRNRLNGAAEWLFGQDYSA